MLCLLPVLFLVSSLGTTGGILLGGGGSVRVLSLRSSLFMVLSPDTPFLSCFLVSARLRVYSSRVLSCLHALFHVGAWCSDPGIFVLFQAQFWFRVGVRTLTLQVCSCCGSVRSRVRSGRALLYPCAFVVFVLLSLVLCGKQLVSFLISCVFMSRFAHG